MRDIDGLMRFAPVIPVIVIDEVSHAVPLAEALVEGGLPVLEVTLRTAAALPAIAAMKEVPGAIVGAGTVNNAADLERCLEAGARFIVSPGLTEPLGRAAIDSGVPFLPGIATAADIMRGLDMGLTRFKFFPAEAAGGIAALKALSAPFAGVGFCPTGGIGADNAPEYLAHPAVLCVGGSWVAPRGLPDRETIARTARAAAALQRTF